jgi:prevent-host-death family protein
MQTMAISKFKTQALKLITEVAQSQESIIITKQGKAIAKIVPFARADNGNKNQPGKLANTLIFENDIISPLGEELWEACQ